MSGKRINFAAIMIQSVIIVALGGAFGSAARFVVSRLVQEHAVFAFPLSTMVGNVVGCLIIGLVCGLADRNDGIGDGLKLFLTVGFCGGVTTFSTFCNEGLSLMRGGNFPLAALYAAASLFVGLLAVQAGAMVAKSI